MKKKRKKKNQIYAFTVLILTIANIFLAIFVFTFVQKIEVEGNTYVKESDIKKIVTKEKGSFNTVYVLCRFHSVTGDELPGNLKSMKAKLKNPWTIKIEVEEKPILGYLYEDGQYCYFDDQGTVVKKSDSEIENVPYVKGIKGANTKMYRKIKGFSEQKLSALDELVGMARKHKKLPDNIVFDESGINVFYGNIHVKLGKYVTKEKASQIFPILEKLEDEEGTLHLEYFKDEKDIVTFKKGEI